MQGPPTHRLPLSVGMCGHTLDPSEEGVPPQAHYVLVQDLILKEIVFYNHPPLSNLEFLSKINLICFIFLHLNSTCSTMFTTSVNVPDKRSRILEVVLVRRLLTWVLGIWSGEGMGKG
jgi:hypothetical protein